MNNIKWLDSNQIQIEPPKRPKKISGTKFGAILGVNPWSTPFEQWCAITRTWEKPYEDTIYTLAGKTIESKQAEYMEKSYGMNLIRPTDIYGADPFKATYGDFFKENKLFSGMWDYLAVDEEGKVDTVLEMKTTKRIEDWQNDVPEYYALQAALYAYLLGVDNVIMVASFLEEKDYNDPAKFVPNIKNTITVEFKVSERYPDFAEKVATVEKWWADYVDTGVSPAFDEKKDAEILKALRTNSLSPESDISAIVAEAEQLTDEIEEVTATVADKEKRLKVLTEQIKKYALEQFRDGDTKVSIPGQRFEFVLSKTNTTELDKKALEADGLLEKYTVPKTNYRLTKAAIKEG